MINFFRHFFIPNESNNFRARTLHVDTLTLFLFLSLAISAIYKVVPLSETAKNVLGIAVDVNSTKLLELTNQQRQKHSLQPLKLNDKLSNAAFKKAKDMFAKNYWAHYAPDGKTPWDFILSSGFQYEVAGENLAKNFLYSDGVVEAWMQSPSHKDNILRSDYTDIGFAIVNGRLNGEDTTLVVQMFGTPLHEEPVINEKVTNNFQKPVLSVQNSVKPLINFKTGTFNYTLILVSLLFLALILDFYFAYRLRVIRITGKHLAHLILLAFVIVSLLIIAKGAIL